MAFISDDDIQKVRDATDLVALIGERSQVQQRGREFWCCCPLHNEKTPSFKIDPAGQFWHCFGCGEGGDAFGFLMKMDELTFPEAVRALAERAHIDIAEEGGRGVSHSAKQRLRDVCASAEEFYHLQLMRSPSSDAAAARSYLSGRALGGEIPKKWQLGFAPGRSALVHHLSSKGFKDKEMIDANVAVIGRDGQLRDRFFNRVMFPIHDVSGQCIAFGGRVIGQGEPKYLNSQETPVFHKSHVLFGLDRAKAKMASTGVAIVAEGYTDIIALHEAGITNSVATLGTALTRDHIRQLSRHAGHRIVYLFDGDAAGQRATERALQFIDDAITPEAGRSKMEICALCLPNNQDPAEFLADHSASAMQELIDNAQPLIEFGIERRLQKHDIGSAQGRVQALEDALSILAPIKESILAKDYAIGLASRLRMREQDVLEKLANMKKPRTFEQESPESAETKARGGSSYEYAITQLPKAEQNRLATEREILGLLAQNPLEALQYAELLSRTRWHDRTHSKIADALVTTLMSDLSATPAKLMDAAAKVSAHAVSLITAAQAPQSAELGEVIRFLADELRIGDKEDAVAELKAKMAQDAHITADEGATLFDQLVEMQKELTRLRATHVRMKQ